MKITRTIKQERDCIQYTGENIAEVLDFINEHNANANHVTLHELTTNFKRPCEIPLDVNATTKDCDWRRNEEYQIYISTKKVGFCHLVGICKNDWIVEDRDGYLVDYADTAFKDILNDGNWSMED